MSDSRSVRVPWNANCATGKRGYPNRRAAKAVLKRLKQHGDRNLNAYPCLDCDSWHVGHRPASIGRGEYTTAEYVETLTRPSLANEESA